MQVYIYTNSGSMEMKKVILIILVFCIIFPAYSFAQKSYAVDIGVMIIGGAAFMIAKNTAITAGVILYSRVESMRGPTIQLAETHSA